MRIVYWGSSAASAEIAKSLIENNFNIVLVITQPDRQKGRGKKLLPTPVKRLAIEKNLPLLTPDDPNSDDVIKEISDYKPEFFFLCAYAKILGKELLDLPNREAINLHFSLLPELRGAAPIRRAIMKGLKRTGVTTFFMNEFLDKGDLILQKELEIKEFETAGELEKRLIPIGKDIAKETIRVIMNDDFKRIKQDESKKSYAKKIRKEERIIDWKIPSVEIVRRINGLSPTPGGFTFYTGKRVILLKAITGNVKDGEPGTIITEKKLEVIAGDNKTVIIELLKPEGKNIMLSNDFINGYRVKEGNSFQTLP
ncbi:MAG: methionyl-tRNA formyltransferase [Candidatus Cloacimonadota bacterium]|nr:MAG: methionyl-tRNA formyltransferase [Candidatus Cloacimonadota bacterium]